MAPPHADDGNERLVKEAWAERGDASAEAPANYAGDEPFEPDLPYFGYQHADFVGLHGDRCGGHYKQWLRKNALNWEELWDDANELSHNYTCPQARRTPVPEELYPTTYTEPM